MSLKQSGIVPIINYSWVQSFARKDKNLKAMTVQGWQHLNMALLLDPDVRATRTETSTAIVRYHVAPPTTLANAIVLYNRRRPKRHISLPSLDEVSMGCSETTVSELTNESITSNTNKEVHCLLKSINLTEGFVGDLITDMLQYAVRNKKIHDNIDTQIIEGESFL